LPIKPFAYTIAAHFVALHIDDVIGAKSTILSNSVVQLAELFFVFSAVVNSLHLLTLSQLNGFGVLFFMF